MTGSLFIVTYAMQTNGRRRTGSYELDLDRMTASLIVDDILDGQFGDLDRIYECPDDVPRQDITEDMARAVRDRIRDQHRPLSYAMASWLQNVLGHRLRAMARCGGVNPMRARDLAEAAKLGLCVEGALVLAILVLTLALIERLV